MHILVPEKMGKVAILDMWQEPLNKLLFPNPKESLYEMSQCMGFPTMRYVRPAKAEISLHIRAVWSEPLLAAWIFCEC